jgi:hypothetical protein
VCYCFVVCGRASSSASDKQQEMCGSACLPAMSMADARVGGRGTSATSETKRGELEANAGAHREVGGAGVRLGLA